MTDNRALGALFELAAAAVLVVLWWHGYFTKLIGDVGAAVQQSPTFRPLVFPTGAPANAGGGQMAGGQPS